MFCFCLTVGVDGGGIGGAVNDKTGVPDISMVTLVDFKRSHGRSWLTDNGDLIVNAKKSLFFVKMKRL
jgi:hypothetical protein